MVCNLLHIVWTLFEEIVEKSYFTSHCLGIAVLAANAAHAEFPAVRSIAMIEILAKLQAFNFELVKLEAELEAMLILFFSQWVSRTRRTRNYGTQPDAEF